MGPDLAEASMTLTPPDRDESRTYDLRPSTG